MIRSILKPYQFTVFAEMNVRDLLENWDNSFTDLPVIKISGEFIGTVSRVSLSMVKSNKSTLNNSAIRAGNALSDLYLIGLTGLLGNPDINHKP